MVGGVAESRAYGWWSARISGLMLVECQNLGLMVGGVPESRAYGWWSARISGLWGVERSEERRVGRDGRAGRATGMREETDTDAREKWVIGAERRRGQGVR